MRVCVCVCVCVWGGGVFSESRRSSLFYPNPQMLLAPVTEISYTSIMFRAWLIN